MLSRVWLMGVVMVSLVSCGTRELAPSSFPVSGGGSQSESPEAPERGGSPSLSPVKSASSSAGIDNSRLRDRRPSDGKALGVGSSGAISASTSCPTPTSTPTPTPTPTLPPTPTPVPHGSASVTVYGVWNGQLDDYFYSPNPNNPVAQYGYGYQGVAFAVFPSAVSGVSMSLIVRCITNAGWHYLWPNYCPEGFYEQPVGYLANSGRNPVYYCAKEGSRGHISTPDLRCNGAGGYYAVMILGYETY